MHRIRLLLVDDHALFRTALRTLLRRHHRVTVVGEARTGQDAVEWVKNHEADVVLMDLAMPMGNGIAATREIVALGRGVRILVLTALTRDEELLEALEAGAWGFAEKLGSPEELLRAIYAVARGEPFLGTDGARQVALQRYAREMNPPPTSPLGLLLRQTVERS